MFFALSDPKHRGVLERLGRALVTLSQIAGLVETERVGRARECRLGPSATLGEAGEWVEAHRRAWEGRLDRFVERAG